MNYPMPLLLVPIIDADCCCDAEQHPAVLLARRVVARDELSGVQMAAPLITGYELSALVEVLFTQFYYYSTLVLMPWCCPPAIALLLARGATFTVQQVNNGDAPSCQVFERPMVCLPNASPRGALGGFVDSQRRLDPSVARFPGWTSTMIRVATTDGRKSIVLLTHNPADLAYHSPLLWEIAQALQSSWSLDQVEEVVCQLQALVASHTADACIHEQTQSLLLRAHLQRALCSNLYTGSHEADSISREEGRLYALYLELLLWKVIAMQRLSQLTFKLTRS